MKIKNTEFESLDKYDGWFVSGGAEDYESVEKKALTMQREALAKGFYCVCGAVGGEGHRLYLVPQRGVRYIIETFEVGSKDGIEPESVYSEISEADASNPLIPYFADGAGLKAKFSEPVTDELLTVLDESLSSVEPMMDDDGEIRPYIKKQNGIHLWWD